MWKRALKATSDYLALVRNPVPPSEAVLFRFRAPEDVARWKVFTDQPYGGRTAAGFELSPTEPESAVFSGTVSPEFDKAASQLQRSGFCGIIAEQAPGQCWDLEPFDSLVIRARGDGRKYVATLRTEDWMVGQASQDRWQAFLFARKGVWQDVHIPLDRFLLTWRGRLVETRSEINARRVISIGISLAAGSDEVEQSGDFSLGLQHIKAERHDGLVQQQ
ncbi:hypothetical protein WJX73_009919 [Symbiochloris irregularis]|uniref:NADH:ubiquinone oxidoreductase intermediate-associated protein 30 domain-containing protein n=1 Tax=Symbiochloris irregularis TaxID=706552 RepID=A0AAW1NM72_9CHLO